MSRHLALFWLLVKRWYTLPTLRKNVLRAPCKKNWDPDTPGGNHFLHYILKATGVRQRWDQGMLCRKVRLKSNKSQRDLDFFSNWLRKASHWANFESYVFRLPNDVELRVDLVTHAVCYFSNTGKLWSLGSHNESGKNQTLVLFLQIVFFQRNLGPASDVLSDGLRPFGVYT